jgi:hypothetical protein
MGERSRRDAFRSHRRDRQRDDVEQRRALHGRRGRRLQYLHEPRPRDARRRDVHVDDARAGDRLREAIHAEPGVGEGQHRFRRVGSEPRGHQGGPAGEQGPDRAGHRRLAGRRPPGVWSRRRTLHTVEQALHDREHRAEPGRLQRAASLSRSETGPSFTRST